MTQRFKQIKSPVQFSKMMDAISHITPYDMDEEDLIAIIFSFMSIYVHDSDSADYVLTMCANNVREFYDRIHIDDTVIDIKTVNRLQ